MMNIAVTRRSRRCCTEEIENKNTKKTFDVEILKIHEVKMALKYFPREFFSEFCEF